MHILTITWPGDHHAAALEWGLEKEGDKMSWFCSSDFPISAMHTAWLESGHHPICRIDAPDANSFDEWDAVWLRRIPSPSAPTSLDSTDHEFCVQSSRNFIRNMFKVMAPDAKWVNPINGYLRCLDSKLLQLKIAHAAGFQVPKTLVSNNPKEIRNFFETLGGNVIAKPFFPQMWVTKGDTSYSFMARKVQKEALNRDDVLMASPLIFQECIHKAYELRITCIGGSMFPAKLDSQSHPDTSLDWRSPYRRVPVSQAEIPPSIESACKEVMSDLGIVMGAFDIIVTDDGQYVFLEVNESGQFLWVEEMEPEITLLDALIEYFQSTDLLHVYSGRKPHFRFNQFLQSDAYREFNETWHKRHASIDKTVANLSAVESTPPRHV